MSIGEHFPPTCRLYMWRTSSSQMEDPLFSPLTLEITRCSWSVCKPQAAVFKTGSGIFLNSYTEEVNGLKKKAALYASCSVCRQRRQDSTILSNYSTLVPTLCVCFSECNCHGKAEECYFNQTVAELSLSLDVHGQKRGGGVCIGCQENTAGINCETCVAGFYRPDGVRHVCMQLIWTSSWLREC